VFSTGESSEYADRYNAFVSITFILNAVITGEFTGLVLSVLGWSERWNRRVWCNPSDPRAVGAVVGVLIAIVSAVLVGWLGSTFLSWTTGEGQGIMMIPFLILEGTLVGVLVGAVASASAANLR